jgi:hypothetical protein
MYVGTDIYLEWDKMTPKEKKARYTGYSINAGDAGYLRASIGMVNENTLLRILMPDHWEYTEEEAKRGGKPYNFEGNVALLEKLARQYLIATLLGKQIEHPDHAEVHELGNTLMKMLKGMGLENVQGNSPTDLSGAVTWLNSVFRFFFLGMRKEKEGMNPRIYISW